MNQGQGRYQQNSYGLSHALGAYHDGNTYRLTSPTNTTNPASGGGAHQSSSSAVYSSVTQQQSQTSKRKHADSLSALPVQSQSLQPHSSSKRRKDSQDMHSAPEVFLDDSSSGTKHWSDEDKTKLFEWLMGPTRDDNWNNLRATKNSCLRDVCALSVFGGKKTYQALKGCFERNFNLFRQVHAFEMFNAATYSGGPLLKNLSESERTKEYEKRLAAARKAEYEVGNISARVIEHWHRMGWYKLFFNRWQSDPAAPGSSSGGPDDFVQEDNDDIQFDSSRLVSSSPYYHQPIAPHGQSTSHYHIPPSHPVPPQINTSVANTDRTKQPHSVTLTNPTPPPTGTTSYSNASYEDHGKSRSSQGAGVKPLQTLDSPMLGCTPTISTSSATPSGDANGLLTCNIPSNMVATYLHLLKMQVQTQKEKLDLMKKTEEREEREGRQRVELERLRVEYQRTLDVSNQKLVNDKQKVEQAISLLSNPNIDAKTKAVLSTYLQKSWAD